MSDEFGAPLAPAAPAPQTPVADPASSAPNAGGTALPAADPAASGEGNQPAEPKRYTQEEVDRVAQRERERAERRADKRYQQILETALGRQQPRPQPPAAATDALPKRESFASDEDFAMAVIEHKAEQKAKEYVDKKSREESEARARQQNDQVEQTYQERVSKVATKYDDFHDVVTRDDLPISPAMAAVIKLHEQGPEIAYHLGKNFEEARRIASLHPLRAVAELGAIAAKLAAAPTPGKQPSNAPAPITPVGGKTVVEKDPNDMTTAEFRRWRKNQIAQRR